MFTAIFVTSITCAATVALYCLAGPIMLVALRTGRWLGQGVVYDRVATPIRFRLAFWSCVFLLTVFTILSVLATHDLIFRRLLPMLPTG